MRVQDVMSTQVQTVAPTMAIDEAWEVMRTKGIHHLVVTDGSRAIGVLSQRDAGGRRRTAARQGWRVADLMSDRVVTVAPDATVRQAANLMRGRSIGSLVVVARGRIAGIVTVADLLELLGRGAERPVVVGRRWTLKHRTPHRKQPTAAGVW